jgi:hypothetical protein
VRRHGERLFFGGLVLAQLMPLWAFRWFPSQDGPIHLEIASLLPRLAGGGDPVAAHYFAVNGELEPTWFLFLPLSALTALTSAPIAEKLLLSAFVVLFAVALRYALEAVRPGAGYLAVLGLPFAFSFPLHMGFYNQCFATVLFFVAVGYWLGRGPEVRQGEILVLTFLLLLTYFAHPVPLVMALLTLGILALVRSAADVAALRRTARPWRGPAWELLARRLLPLLVASLPALALLGLFLLRQQGQQVGATIRWPFLALAKRLAVLYSLVSFDRRELILSIATLVVFLTVAALLVASRIRRRSFSARDAPLVAALAAVVVYFAAPGTIAGGGLVNHRVQLFIPLLLLLWFASDAALERFRPALATAGAILTAGFLVVHSSQYRALNAELEEYLSGEQVLAPRSTLLSLSLAHHGVAGNGPGPVSRVQPFQHAAGHLAARRELVDLVNFQASTGYFPVVYRSECDPYRRLGSVRELEEVAVPRPRLDGFDGFPCSIDYVLLWGLTSKREAEPEVAALVAAIEARFEPVFVSPQHGLLHIYRQRREPVAAGRAGPISPGAS